MRLTPKSLDPLTVDGILVARAIRHATLRNIIPYITQAIPPIDVTNRPLDDGDADVQALGDFKAGLPADPVRVIRATLCDYAHMGDLPPGRYCVSF